MTRPEAERPEARRARTGGRNTAGGSGNTALTFTYEVRSGDMDSNGIWLPKNQLDLRSGAIRDAATNTADAALSYARAGLQSGHKVDGSLNYTQGEPTPTLLCRNTDSWEANGVAKFDALLEVRPATDKPIWTEVPYGRDRGDGTATGTIVNTDPIPQAWITRFGRTVGSQVIDAVTARFEDDGRSHVTVGGMSVSGSGPYPVERSDWNEWNTEMDAWGGAHEMTERELLLGSSFHLTSRERPEGGPAFAAWGRVARDGFEADVGDVKVDGDVTTGLIGFDGRVGPGAGRSAALAEQGRGLLHAARRLGQ